MLSVFLQVSATLTLVASGTDQRLQALSAPSDTVVWASGVGGTFVRSLDGGRTWTANVVHGHEERQFRDIHAVDADVAYLMSAGSGDESRIFKTIDGGETWTEQFVNPLDDGFLDCMDFWDPLHGLAYSDSVGGSIVLFETTDGASWNRVEPSILPDALPGEGGFAASGTCVATVEDSAFVAMGVKSARVLRTRDRGQSWQALETPVAHDNETSGLSTVAFLPTGEGVVAGGDIGDADTYADNVAVSEDWGESWWQVGGPTFPGAIYGIAIAPGAPTLTLVAVGPGGASYSRDNGSSWTSLSVDTYWSVGFTPAGIGFLVGPDGRIGRLELEN